MARFELNEAGEKVCVDNEAFGCVVIEPSAPTKSNPKAKPEAAPVTDGEE
jgi:hypothetical protein